MFVLFNIPGTMIVGFLVSRFVAPVGCSVLGSLWAGVGVVGVVGVSISSLVECLGISCSSISGNKSYSSRSKDVSPNDLGSGFS